MKQTVIENEIYLTKKYLRNRNVAFDGVCIIGTHPLAKRIADCIGQPASAAKTADGIAPDASELWYIYDMAAPDPDGLKKAAQLSVSSRAPLLCIILLENIKPHPSIQRYAEMELLSVMNADLGGVRAVLSGCPNAKAIVLDRLFGAEYDSLFLADTLREAEETGSITVAQTAATRCVSALYLPDAITSIAAVSKRGKPGNLYHATSFFLSEFEFKSAIYKLLARHSVRLRMTDEAAASPTGALSEGKLRSLGWEPVCSFSDALRCTVPAYSDKFDFQADFISNGYSGKLPLLRRVQKEMLRELDRICRKHNVKYFLSGGSMLGAARHGGYIPWDDDIDVGMLREDFEKFKQVAPAELDERFSYQTFSNRNGYHYFFDRITAKNTYFASRYSDGYEMPKGISVDIFVYDRVPDDPKAWKRHWKRLMNKRLLMNVRWKNEPRGEGKARLFSKLLLPFLKLKSMDRYSSSYDKATRRYENRATNTVMVPATDHIYRDAMPREWFTEVLPWQFEGVDTFMPKGYDGFLRIWYGEDYMTMLPLSERQPYHDYYRLDLGSYAEETSGEAFDFSGELIERSH